MGSVRILISHPCSNPGYFNYDSTYAEKGEAGPDSSPRIVPTHGSNSPDDHFHHSLLGTS